MTNSPNLSGAIECIKTIVDSIRCTDCDKAEEQRVRYPCGHTACDGCFAAAEGCMLCLTPPNTQAKPVTDLPYSRRAKNACTLLSIFQDTFNIDVYRTLRKSEQLKAEKELFPDCIQAPVKYCNKRKSLLSKSNKENQSVLCYPGEIISRSKSFKMNNCNNYVQEWLNSTENHPRKVLGDLSVNCEYKSVISKNKDTRPTLNQYASNNRRANNSLKRTNSNDSYSLLDISIKSDSGIKKVKTDDYDIPKTDFKLKNKKKSENDESGIVIDDEPILIEDSQSQLLDKDALALIAVEAAENQESYLTVSSEKNTFQSIPQESNKESESENDKPSKHVKFLKKSALNNADCKQLCCSAIGKNTNNVSITIESNSFSATINITDLSNTQSNNVSVHTQTQISEIAEINKSNNNIVHDISSDSLKVNLVQNANVSATDLDPVEKCENKRILISPNIFELDEDKTYNKKCTVIDESDSDGAIENNILHVTADVHRSCDTLDYGILSEINTNEICKRSRKKARGVTPDSNNSSDKENCDPNRNRRRKNTKKYLFKK